MAIAEPRSKETDLTTLVARFRSEDKCRAYLEELRWPDGVRCPRCDAVRSISRLEDRGQFDCDSCGYQFSVRAGTVFHGSHLPLWKWFLAVYVMTRAEQGISANRLRHLLQVSYKTAWHLCHRIRAVMKDEAVELVRERGEGRLRVGETRVLGLVEQDGNVRLRVSERDGGRAEDDAEIGSSAFAGYSTYRHTSAKHLPAYLDEMAFRHSNQGNAYLFRDTLLRLIEAESMPYSELIAGTRSSP